MKKFLLMLAMPFLALSISAEEASTLNAVCVDLKSGDSKYVAFQISPLSRLKMESYT